MNDDIEYEKFTQEIYNEILKNLSTEITKKV